MMDLLSSESCLPQRAHCRSHSAAHHGSFKPPHPFWLHTIPWPLQFLRHNSCPKEPRISAFPAVSSHLESTPATQLCVDAGPSPPPTPLLSSVPSWCRDIVRWWCLWSCLCQLWGHSKILQAGAWTTGVYFLTLLHSGNPWSRCKQIWFLVRALFLAYRPWLLAVSSHGHSSPVRAKKRFSAPSSSYKNPSPVTLGPHPHDLIWPFLTP